MKLLINAVNLSSAGGLNVALNFLKSLRAIKSLDCQVYVAAPWGCGYEELAADTVHLIYVPSRLEGVLGRLYLKSRWLKTVVERVNPDVIFSMGNFAIATYHKQVVLLHLPHVAYKNDAEIWRRLGLSGNIQDRLRVWQFERRLAYIDVLLVQTETIKNRITTHYPQLPAVKLLPQAYTQLKSEGIYPLPFKKENGLTYLLCLSRYYPHKNIEILIEVARLIRQQGKPYRIITTVEAAQHPRAKAWLERLKREQLEDIIITIGNVSGKCVPSLYQQVDGLILPTLMESFTATYVDAMRFGTPIFTSERDFSMENCGECAFYFNPLSAESILEVVHNAFGNPQLLREKIELGYKRSSSLPDWDDVARLGLQTLESLVPYFITQ